ncbi:hypothetical protein [Arthrobacter sp. L77]|uniref:hypothetical protein n=1 Tax=Arthrobacter sp. L77 TaxID=1496689 RepID=UPI000A6FE4B9|nr:hypothetical protein [Arthrobacter sp. L77]
MPGRTVVVIVPGLATCVAYAVVGTLQILVWNPLAAVPGLGLPEIYRQMREAREPMAVNLVVIWGVTGVALGLMVGLLGTLRRWSAPRIAALYLCVITLGAPSHVVASFNPGMSLADAFAIGGGDYTIWGAVLYGVSAAALLALIVLLRGARRVALGSEHDGPPPHDPARAARHPRTPRPRPPRRARRRRP